MGTVKRASANPLNASEVALPLVYALLTSKRQVQYSAVLRAVLTALEEMGIIVDSPRLLTDFEVAIINSCIENLPNSIVLGCFFHLKQSVFRHIQSEGLQEAYCDVNDPTIRTYTNMLVALAFVPVPDVISSFRILQQEMPPQLVSIANYFSKTYITGKLKIF